MPETRNDANPYVWELTIVLGLDTFKEAHELMKDLEDAYGCESFTLEWVPVIEGEKDA